MAGPKYSLSAHTQTHTHTYRDIETHMYAQYCDSLQERLRRTALNTFFPERESEREKHIETHVYAQHSVSLERNAWTHAYQRGTLIQDELS